MQVLCKALNYGIKFNAVECRIGIGGLYFYSEKSAWSISVEYINNLYWIDIIENDIEVAESICTNNIDKIVNLIIDVFH